MSRMAKIAILFSTVMLAATAFAVSRQDESEAKAEKIVNIACTSCHDIRKIQTQALNAAAWNGIVNSMIERGASVEKSDIPLLVSYLEDNFGPLPEGEGKQI